MTDEDIEAIIDEAFYLRKTPWVKKVCQKEHVINNGALILVDYKNESYT